MNVWDNTEQVKRVIQESMTYIEVFRKLGLNPDQDWKQLITFIKVHNLKMLPFDPNNLGG